MANEITLSAALQCLNGNFNFPKHGFTNLAINQATAGGGGPGWFAATNAAQGNLLDLTTLNLSSIGGILIFWNPAAAGQPVIQWGPDDGAGNIKIIGDLQPGGAPALWQLSTAMTTTKLRFKCSAASLDFQIYVLNP